MSTAGQKRLSDFHGRNTVLFTSDRVIFEQYNLPIITTVDNVHFTPKWVFALYWCLSIALGETSFYCSPLKSTKLSAQYTSLIIHNKELKDMVRSIYALNNNSFENNIGFIIDEVKKWIADR